MNKSERELRRLLKDYPGARLQGHRTGYTLIYGGRRLNLGGLVHGFYDREKIVRFLEGKP